MSTPPVPRLRYTRRRALLAAVGAAGVVAVGGALVASEWDGEDRADTSPVPDGEPPALATPIPSPVSIASRVVLPAGWALVASPHLPLTGVGPDDLDHLFSGTVADWSSLGAASARPVDVFALDGLVPAGARPSAVLPDYDALATALTAHSGGVALVPIGLVDFRVNALAVGGVDPLAAAVIDGDPLVRVGIIGDVMPGRRVHRRMVEHGDFARPFAKVAPLLASFDLTVANLEGNLSADLPQPPDTFPEELSFVSSPAVAQGLIRAGVDVVSLANNHTTWNAMGWGATGLLDTIAALDDVNLPHFGAGADLADARRPWVATRGGVPITFLGIDGVTANLDRPDWDLSQGVVGAEWGATDDGPGTSPYTESSLVEQVAAAVADGGVVIPYIHAGTEYVGVPPAWLRAGARAAIDAGAAAVVTNHPHVVQGMEVHNGRPIVYSPGNFVFDQMEAWELRTGAALELGLRGDRVVRVRLHGVVIEDFHQPRLMDAGEQAALEDRFWGNSARMSSRS